MPELLVIIIGPVIDGEDDEAGEGVESAVTYSTYCRLISSDHKIPEQVREIAGLSPILGMLSS